MIETFFVFLAGFFFAFLQFSFFFTLQANVSSAGLTYLLTTVCSLGGAVIGLSIRRTLAVKYENLMIGSGAAGFYLVHLLVQWRPFDNAYLSFMHRSWCFPACMRVIFSTLSAGGSTT